MATAATGGSYTSMTMQGQALQHSGTCISAAVMCSKQWHGAKEWQRKKWL